ncbi:MAG: sorbosone dehydrogenase family protein, partial [Burkholderiales bacterium]
MNVLLSRYVLIALVVAGLSACGGAAQLTVAAGTGPNPALPEPERSLIPVVHIAAAKGWPAGAKPAAA